MTKHQALVNGLVHLEIYNKTTITLQNSMSMHSTTDKLLPKHQHFFPHLANFGNTQTKCRQYTEWCARVSSMTRRPNATQSIPFGR